MSPIKSQARTLRAPSTPTLPPTNGVMPNPSRRAPSPLPFKMQMEGWEKRGSSAHSIPNTWCHREGEEEGPRQQLPGSCPLPPEAWKKELKELASQVVIFSKENEPKNKEVGAEQRSYLGRDEMEPSLRTKIVPKSDHTDQQESKCSLRCCCLP